MSEPKIRRPREKYSKLICLGCRARRIRCILPDPTIQPSPSPQLAEKACSRCSQNSLDCVVDSTTLGRPAQKRMRGDEVSGPGKASSSSREGIREDDDLADLASLEVEDFLLSHPEIGGDVKATARMREERRSRSEMVEVVVTPYHLFSALLSRDKQFAASLSSPPRRVPPVLDIVDNDMAAVLDSCLVWHRCTYPAIPRLTTIRQDIASMDSALDVPTPRCVSYRHLQPTFSDIARHHAQQLQFLLPRHDYTVQTFVLAAEYKPLLLANDQTSAPHAIKAIPYITSARPVASDLGYAAAGTRLEQALQKATSTATEIERLILEALCWVRLALAHDTQAGMLVSLTDHAPSSLQTNAHSCLEALRSAFTTDRIPAHLLLACTGALSWAGATQAVSAIREHWRDTARLGTIVHEHETAGSVQKSRLQLSIQKHCRPSEAIAFLHLANSTCHVLHTYVVGQALFFAITAGALSSATHTSVPASAAVGISDTLIAQLLAHSEDDPERPAHRRFMEEHGPSRTAALEGILTSFITAADTLTLQGVPYVGPARQICGHVLYTCKELVETNAAKLKGWGGLDDRVDVQMILFVECARRLEGMASGAGTEEAMRKGCLLTATAKLVRSLHAILAGFKRAMVLGSCQANKLAEPTDGAAVDSATANQLPHGLASIDDKSKIESELQGEQFEAGGGGGGGGVPEENPFADWDIWPHFDPFDPNDFSDLFGDSWAWDLGQ